MHMHDLLCIDDAPNNVLDSTQIRKAEARKLAPTTTTSAIAGSRPVVVPSRLSIRGPSTSISTSTAWLQSTQEAKGIERLATAGLLSAKQVKGVEGLLTTSSTTIVVIV